MVIKLDTEENTFSKHLFGIFQQHLCQKAQPCKHLWLQRYFVHSCSIITQKSLNRSFRFGWSFPFLKNKEHTANFYLTVYFIKIIIKANKNKYFNIHIFFNQTVLFVQRTSLLEMLMVNTILRISNSSTLNCKCL